jgi:hypothetical protein
MSPKKRVWLLLLGLLLVVLGMLLGVTALTLCFSTCGSALALKGGAGALGLLVLGFVFVAEARSL